ncbi:MAG TPA: potassium transporter KtrB [Candidatus Mediterraneibacter pullistercoris]|nr:potassium transporter KtrB [Candidatus Mediterraneibacter pullistercoris]
MEKKVKSPRRIRLNTMQIIALGFFGVIFFGGVLLWLPVCNQKPIEFIDALFTSVTSVCVTGLVTVVPAEQFTLAGQIVMLLLIQIGGLGVIACMVSFFLILGKRISMKRRIMIQEAYGLDTLSGLVKFIIRILRGTFIVEGIGAVLFSIKFIPEFGVAKGIWYSIFHSVSGFCNAGIDIIGDSSFIRYVDSPLISLTTMFLIVMGGLGFPVWHDIYITAKKGAAEKGARRRIFTRLSLQSKIVLSMTVLLIVLGTAGFFLLEFNNPDTMKDLSVPDKVLASAFQSVTTRTAGFASVSQSGLTESSRLLGCILMFVGGSPAGTAGGIKTTTAAMLLLTVISVLRGRKDTECFGRRVEMDIVRSGITITVITFTCWLLAVVAMSVFEPKTEFLNLMYEASSAIGTVGLSADLTASLSRASHIVLMLLMYIGRIGPLTMALVFAGRTNKGDRFRELPEKKLMLG